MGLLFLQFLTRINVIDEWMRKKFNNILYFAVFADLICGRICVRKYLLTQKSQDNSKYGMIF